MRISDWSSDVCSSDLRPSSHSLHTALLRSAPERPWPPPNGGAPGDRPHPTGRGNRHDRNEARNAGPAGHGHAAGRLPDAGTGPRTGAATARGSHPTVVHLRTVRLRHVLTPVPTYLIYG